MIQSLQIEADLIIARRRPTNDGYTWTLASRLGHMLGVAQERFGERNLSYTILGVEFCGDIPQVWYPGDCGHIVVQLTQGCLTNVVQACYQLAHECIHLLCPSGRPLTNVLDEGLATHFAHWYVQNEFQFDMPATVQSYQTARVLVEQLLGLDAGCIKSIRAQQPAIYKASAADICAGCPACPPEIADQLAKPFTR